MGPAPESFRSNASTSGRTTALALASATRWYVVSAGGGVWKTDNAGTGWTPLTDDQPILSGSTIAMDPTDPNALWVGTGEADCSIDSLYGAGILLSADGGAGWTQVAADLFGRARIAKIAVDPSSSAGSRTLYAAATGCLSVEAERGIDSSVHGGLAKSTDGGRSWSFLPAFPSGSTANDVVVDPSGVVLMSRFALPPEDGSHTGIYRSTNGGSSFTKLTAGLPADWTTVGNISLAIAPSNPQVIYAVLGRGIGAGYGTLVGAYRSSDGGANWSKTAFADIGRQWNYNNAIQVDPTDATVVYVGGVGLWKSIDSGASWTLTASGWDHHGIAILASDPQTIVTASDSGVTKLAGGGSIGSSANGVAPNALAITQGYAGAVDPIDGNIVYLGTQDNGVLRSSGGALLWATLLYGDSGQQAVDFDVPATVYESIDGYIERSDDSGQNFTIKMSGISAEAAAWLSPLTMDLAASGTLYTGLMRVYKTTDRAEHWTPLSAQPLGDALTAVAVTGNDLYTGDQAGSVWSSSNGGASWQGPYRAGQGLPGDASQRVGRYLTSLAVDPTNPSVAYATYAGFNAFNSVPGHVFRTTDHGSCWMDVSGSVGDVPVNWVAIDQQHPNLLYLAANNGVFKSMDRGATWTPLKGGLPNVQVSQVFLNRRGDTLYAITHGRSVYRAGRTVP